jgi:elongation factor Tu
MGSERILVKANVRLLSTAEGGRTMPIRGSYRPNHNFFGPQDRNMTMGVIDLPSGSELHPGESIELPITFWN